MLLQNKRKKINLRTEYLNSVGIKESRFQNQEVLKELELVIQKNNTELSDGTL